MVVHQTLSAARAEAVVVPSASAPGREAVALVLPIKDLLAGPPIMAYLITVLAAVVVLVVSVALALTARRPAQGEALVALAFPRLSREQVWRVLAAVVAVLVTPLAQGPHLLVAVLVAATVRMVRQRA